MSNFEPSFVPSQIAPLTADEEIRLLEEQLSTQEGQDVLVIESPIPPIGRSWAFDFEEHHFVIKGARGPVETHGRGTLRYWIEKALRTARGAHPIHPPDYGMDEPFDLIGRFHDGDPALEQKVIDCLTFHPRITDVVDFERTSNPSDDYLAVSFRVVLDDNSALSFLDLRLS